MKKVNGEAQFHLSRYYVAVTKYVKIKLFTKRLPCDGSIYLFTLLVMVKNKRDLIHLLIDWGLCVTGRLHGPGGIEP